MAILVVTGVQVDRGGEADGDDGRKVEANCLQWSWFTFVGGFDDIRRNRICFAKLPVRYRELVDLSCLPLGRAY